jgi:hypothetical protein
VQEADEQQKQQLAALAAAYGQTGAQPAAFPGMMHGPIMVPHIGQAASSAGASAQQQTNAAAAQMWITGAPIAYGQPGQVRIIWLYSF